MLGRSRIHDPVEEQLRDIARQGSAAARLSHLFAGLLIFLFSLASLVALGSDALVRVQESIAHGALNIPSTIALSVTTLLVPAMDVAMLRAARTIRLLAARRADASEMRLHKCVIIGVSLVEASTYCYMSAIFEHPVGVAWGLVIARALSAPLIGVYLAMDRPLPVTARDILAQVELATGHGVIRDAVTVANDHTAPLARKMALYGASAVMTPVDRSRLGEMIAVMQEPSLETMNALALPAPATMLLAQQRSQPAPSPARPPTGPGSPTTAHTSRSAREQADSGLLAMNGVPDETPQYDEEQESSRVVHINRSRSAKNANKRLRREGRHARNTRIENAVEQVIEAASHAGEDLEAVAINELTRRVNDTLNASGDAAKTSAKTVKYYRAKWLRTQRQQAVQ